MFIFSAFLSFFGGKKQGVIVILLGIVIASLGVLYMWEKTSHSNTKVELANKVSELSTIKNMNKQLEQDQETKQLVIDGLQNQVVSYKKDFEEYRKQYDKMLEICENTKEIDKEDSKLKVLDEKSNEEYVKAINSVLGFN
jgi:uncharacterized protein HemX